MQLVAELAAAASAVMLRDPEAEAITRARTLLADFGSRRSVPVSSGSRWKGMQGLAAQNAHIMRLCV